MPDGNKQAIARRIAEILLSTSSVHFNADKPFLLTSGRASPVYIDCRRLISFLDERREIIAAACTVLKESCDIEKIDYIAGGETAGIAYAAWISEALGKPMLYVRKKPKGFGRGSQIEGEMRQGARVLLVEDLTTDGGSKVLFAQALRDAGAVIEDVFAVFFYGIFKESVKILGDAGLKLHHLSTWQDVLAVARERKMFDAATLAEVEKFLASPVSWSEARGGVGAL